jgi:ABC-2 type transport system ATP-binding protein
VTAGGPAAGPASTGDFAVRVAGVTKRYGNHVAVDGVSFEVPTGVIYGVLGPNGAGKSTTLRMINDIIAPDAGEIRLLGGLRPGREAAAHVGFLPEERGLYPKMRVSEMIAFMGELRGLPARDARTRTGAWLERLGLGQWARNKVQDLSKGMQQKVQFAATMIHEPELVILDEPWSGLDPINADVLRDVVREQKAAGRTILFSTHLMEQAEQICDHICIIARGKKVLDGRLADVKRAAADEGRVALGFVDAAARARAEADGGPLADRALVAARHAGRGGLDAATDVEVELAAGADGGRLLAALVAAGAGLRRFEIVTPTLHQIFVDKVGVENASVAARADGAPEGGRP